MKIDTIVLFIVPYLSQNISEFHKNERSILKSWNFIYAKNISYIFFTYPMF